MQDDKAVMNPKSGTLDSTNSVSRRSLLRSATLIVGGAATLTTLTAQPAAAGKMAQATASYQTTPKDGKRCDGCTLFQAPDSCKLVDGSILASGWCRFFVKKV